MWMNQYDEGTEVRARNRLTLVERIKAIKAYEKTPVYQKIGLMFNCSAKQIRNIIKNKQRILNLYISKGVKMKPVQIHEDRRIKKINTLRKVMHEWYRRAQQQSPFTDITNKMIQSRAVQAKQILNIENFYPSTGWLLHFRQTHRVYMKERTQPPIEDPDPTSLEICKIINYITQLERVENESEPANEETETNGEERTSFDEPYGASALMETTWNEETWAPSNPKQEISQVRDEHSNFLERMYDEDMMSPRSPRLEPIDVIEIESSDDEDGGGKKNAVGSVQDALEHLKPLEEFALIKENYRAIGLINQLQTILQNSAKIENSR